MWLKPSFFELLFRQLKLTAMDEDSFWDTLSYYNLSAKSLIQFFR